MIFDSSKIPKFNGINIGSIFAGLLLAAAIRAFVVALAIPLSTILINEINYLVRRSYPEVMPIGDPPLIWALTITTAIGGTILVVLGLCSASWISAREREQKKKTLA